ncbi:MAG: hypothetical protein ACRD07_10680 [Acidimicrobiales bacterium]
MLLRAPSGIFGEPPGLYPDDVVAAAGQYGRIDHHEVVEGTNPYSIVRGARGAAAVAAHCCSRAPLQRPAGWGRGGQDGATLPTQSVEPHELATTGAGERGG